MLCFIGWRRSSRLCHRPQHRGLAQDGRRQLPLDFLRRQSCWQVLQGAGLGQLHRDHEHIQSYRKHPLRSGSFPLFLVKQWPVLTTFSLPSSPFPPIPSPFGTFSPLSPPSTPSSPPTTRPRRPSSTSSSPLPATGVDLLAPTASPPVSSTLRTSPSLCVFHHRLLLTLSPLALQHGSLRRRRRRRSLQEVRLWSCWRRQGAQGHFPPSRFQRRNLHNRR